MDIYSKYRDNYTWFLKVDERAYINAQTLAFAITDMSPSNRIYLGKPANGRVQDQAKLQLNNRPYCLSMTYLWSKALVEKIGPNLSTCRSNLLTEFSDVEV